MPDDLSAPKAAPEHQQHIKPLRKPDLIIKGNLNHYNLLKHDADMLADLAASDANTPSQKNSCARAAILLYIVSLEALINRIIDDFWPNPEECETKEQAKKWSTTDKWYKVPLRLTGKSFDKGITPYQYLPILINIRNDFVHAKRDTFPIVWDVYHNQELNRKETYRSAEQPIYSQVGLIRAPSEWIASDANQIKTVTEQLVSTLRCLLGNSITDQWLYSDKLTTNHGQRLTVTRYFQDL